MAVGTLPSVTLAGDHSNIQVTFQLPSTMMETLPDSLASGAPITVHPVLFNKGSIIMVVVVIALLAIRSSGDE